MNKNSVLVVDDENSNILALTHILSPDYTVYAAKNGESAIKAAQTHLPDIILLDIIMPDMDGYEVIAALKGSEKTQDITVIFITGLNSPVDEEKGFALGAADYITKPFSSALVKLRVQNQIKLLKQFRSNKHDIQQMGETIKHRENLLNAVNRAASVLLTAEDDEAFKTSLLEGMEIIGRSVDVDCVEIWQNEMIDDTLHAVLKHYWFSETGHKIKSESPAFSFPYSAAPGWEKKLSMGEYIHGPVSGFSQEEQDFLNVFRIKTVLVIPTFVQNRFWGFCCIDDCRNSRSFTEDEVNILRSGSYMLTNAINRSALLHEQKRMISRIETIIGNLPGMVFQCLYDPPYYTYTFVSKGCKELTGYEPEELIGKNAIKFIDMLHPDDADIVAKHGAETYPLDLPFETIFRMIMKDGTVKWIWERSRVIEKKPDGTPSLLEGYHTDITERRQLETAEAASRAKSAFLANMSHEMRTPMNVVVGLTDLMLEEENPELNFKENLKKISTAGNTLLNLINDVLDISKIEAGKLELKPVKYDLPSLLNDIITLNVIRIEEKPITFQLDINEDLPCKLNGDDLRLKQIINNILSNAFKYTQSGTVVLGLSTETKGDDVWLSAYVSDTGIGIRKEDLKKLFIDYSQVDIQANRMIEGTGLGLSISKSLAEMMDGEIRAESTYGKGSTFRVRIRQGFVSDTTIGPAVTENLRKFRYTEDKRIASKKLVRPDLSYASVLVVDDMQTNLDVASGLLRRYKMQVDCVLNGQEAIERIRRGGNTGQPVYDAIFMDHMMPGMDGIEATAAIRALNTEYARNIPIIALTANAIQGMEDLFYTNSFQAFLAKPIDSMLLDSLIRKWIHKKGET